ncbi:MAG TPA: hypothetical protein VIK28_09335, partial [Sedimentisphaerales bacterium]
MVSELPYIVETKTPVNESGPWAFMISVIRPSEPLPESGLKKAMGKASGGIPIKFVTGERIDVNTSIAPLARKTPMAKSIATRYGMMRT